MKKQGTKAAKRIFHIDPVLIAGDPQHTSVQVDFMRPADMRDGCNLVLEAHNPDASGFAIRAFRLTPETVARLWAARYANQTTVPVLDLSETDDLPMTFRALNLSGPEMARLMAVVA